jgi:hypothetical protein
MAFLLCDSTFQGPPHGRFWLTIRKQLVHRRYEKLVVTYTQEIFVGYRIGTTEYAHAHISLLPEEAHRI